MINLGIAVLVEEDNIPRCQDGKMLRGGCFAVDHTRGRLRLIFARRPINATEELFWTHGSSCHQFPNSFTTGWGPHETLRASGDDMECFSSTPWRTRQLDPLQRARAIIIARLFTDPGAKKQRKYRVCPHAVAMGDVNGVAIAQKRERSTPPCVRHTLNKFVGARLFGRLLRFVLGSTFGASEGQQDTQMSSRIGARYRKENRFQGCPSTKNWWPGGWE